MVFHGRATTQETPNYLLNSSKISKRNSINYLDFSNKYLQSFTYLSINLQIHLVQQKTWEKQSNESQGILIFYEILLFGVLIRIIV